jgi:hypothetical protein
MMENGHFGLHRRASMALGQLSDTERARIAEQLDALADLPPSEWPARIVKRADVATTLYLISVDNSLRLLIAAPDGQAPEVVDIVRHEMLEQFAKAK